MNQEHLIQEPLSSDSFNTLHVKGECNDLLVGGYKKYFKTRESSLLSRFQVELETDP